MEYNVETADVDLVFTAGDTIDMTINVTVNDVAYDMTGMQLDMMVRRYDGLLIKALTSAGSPADITIDEDEFTILADGFDTPGIYLYDVQLTDGTKIKSIISGRLIVKKQFTS